MSMDGWVKLWRRALDSKVFADPHLWHLFSRCILLAAREEHTVTFPTGRGETTVTLAPGQLIFGRNSWARELRIESPSTVERRMHRLKKFGCIDMDVRSHFTIITVVNWHIYQRKETGRAHPTAHPTGTQVTGNEHPKRTYKKLKKGENGENDESEKKDEAGRDDHARASWKTWEQVKNDVQRRSLDIRAKINFADAKPHRTKQGDSDRNLRVKACYLVATGILPENWLYDATEAVIQGKRKDREVGYWYDCLTSGALKLGKNLPRLLVQCEQEIPPEVLKGEDLKKRRAL